jgi:hypothetical protein
MSKRRGPSVRCCLGMTRPQQQEAISASYRPLSNGREQSPPDGRTRLGAVYTVRIYASLRQKGGELAYSSHMGGRRTTQGLRWLVDPLWQYVASLFAVSTVPLPVYSVAKCGISVVRTNWSS